MEEKKVIKISLSTFFLILAIIVIVVMCCYIYKLYNDKQEETEKVLSLKNTVNSLQETINSISNNNEEENNNSLNEVVGNDANYKELSSDNKEYIKNVIETYYKLLGKKEEEPASMLNELGFIVQAVQDPDLYAPSGYVQYPNNEYMWTGIKYNEYVGAMFNYMSEGILKSEFKEFVEYNGYLYISQYLNDSCQYIIQSMELQESSTNKCRYLIKVKKSNTSNIYTEEITLTRGNGDFVISEIKGK